MVPFSSDETMPIETASSIAHVRKEDGQVVGFPVKLLFEGRDCLVVQFGSRRSSVGVVIVQDGM